MSVGAWPRHLLRYGIISTKKESTTFSIDSPSTTKRYYPKFSDIEWFIAKHRNHVLEFEFAVLLWHLLCWFKRIIKRHIQNGFPVWGAFMFPTSLLRRETEQEGIKLDRNSNFWGNIICLFNSHSMAASRGPMMIFKWVFHGPFLFHFI